MLASSLSLVIFRGALGLRRNHWVLQLFSWGEPITFALLLVALASWSVLLPSLPKGILGSTGKQCDGARVVATHRSVMVTHCSQPRFFWVPPPKFIFADEFELNFFFTGIKFKWSSFFSKHWPKHTVSFEVKMVKKNINGTRNLSFVVTQILFRQNHWHRVPKNLVSRANITVYWVITEAQATQTNYFSKGNNKSVVQYHSKVSWQKKWFLIASRFLRDSSNRNQAWSN